VGQIKKLAQQTAIYGLSSIIGRFLNFLLVPFYTRVFLPDEYGVVTELYTYVVFLLIFLTFGMETGYFRFMRNDADKEHTFSTIICSIFSLTLLFVLAIFLFIDPIAQFLQYSDNKIYIELMAIIIAIDAFVSIPFAKLRHINKPLRFAVIKLLNIAVNIGCNILFLVVIPHFAESNVWLRDTFICDNMVIYVFISNLIASVITLLLLLPEIFGEKLVFDYDLFKRLFAYSFPLLLAGLAGQTNELIDRVLLKHFIVVPDGVSDSNQYIMSQLGIYGANFKLSIIITIFIQAFRYAFEPMFFSKSKGEDSMKLYADIMKYFIIFCLTIFLGMMFYIDIIKYFIGEKYHEGLNIVPIVLLANILLGVLYTHSLWYKLTDKTKYGTLIAGIGSLITIVFNIVLIPLLGYFGSACTHLICYVTIVTISYFLGRKYYNVPYDLKSIFIYIVSALILYYASTFISLKELPLKLVANTGLLLIFILLVVKKENVLQLIKRMVKR